MTTIMGDTTFSVIAEQPKAAMVALPLSLTAEIIAGWLVGRSNWIDLTPNPSKHYEIALVTGSVGWIYSWLRAKQLIATLCINSVVPLLH